MMETLPASHPSVRKRRKRFRGQGVVEFALVLPVMLIVVFVIIELARLLHAWLAIENGARFGVRYAVTGEYDDLYCATYPAGECDDVSEQEAARIPSIKDAAAAGSVAILRNPAAPVNTPGFFKVTVCSSKTIGGSAVYDYHAPVQNPVTKVWTPAWCEDKATGLPAEDAGGPGDRVSVTVDFEHPLITPIVSTWWPKLHLSARREGIVEKFRVARVVGLPATISVPTFTPTNTATPTETPTPTDTATPTTTPCKVPPVVNIIQPLDGTTYNTEIPSQATAYDPDNADPAGCAGVGADGLGIDRVDFTFEYYDGNDWNLVYFHSEFSQAYCGFSGDAPCSTRPTNAASWPNGAPMSSGLHRVRVVAEDDEGDMSPEEVVQFWINVPPTETPTVTLTPTETPTVTATPTIDCNDIIVGSYYTSNENLLMWILNNNPRTIHLTDSSTTWTEQSASEYVNQLQFNWAQYYPGDDYSSPTTYGPGNPNSFPHPSGSWIYWWADFDNTPGGALYGNFATTLTFDGICSVSAALFVATPTYTPTPTVTATASNTPPPTSTPLPTNTPTVTRTPTITPTASLTPTPSCSLVSVTGTRLNGDNFEVRVQNLNSMPAYLTASTMTWDTFYAPPMYFDFFRFRGNAYYGSNSFSSPVSASGFSVQQPAGSTDWWEADFNLQGQPFAGSFTADLTLSFPGWGSCTVSGTRNVPTPTNTPIPTDTATPTNTPIPTSTSTPLPTHTPAPPTSTSTPTGTATPPDWDG